MWAALNKRQSFCRAPLPTNPIWISPVNDIPPWSSSFFNFLQDTDKDKIEKSKSNLHDEIQESILELSKLQQALPRIQNQITLLFKRLREQQNKLKPR